MPQFVGFVKFRYNRYVILSISATSRTMKIKLNHNYNNISSLENLYAAWEEFLSGKGSKIDVQIFERNLFENIANLHSDLADKTYQHGDYHSFYINDPKRRHIHKANVRDRLLHHAIYRLLYPFFEKTFISDSYSCRLGKGVYKAIDSFESKLYKVSKNNIKTCWILKCDIRKFFDSIDHKILLDILCAYIPDPDIILLLRNIIDSYHNAPNSGVGLPLGNLTSQLFANIYLNVFDQWIKHTVKITYYIRYADDFVVLAVDKSELEKLTEKIRIFLLERLNLTLHPTKIFLKTHNSGMDFLGWVNFPKYKKLRTKTRQRAFKKLITKPRPKVLQSYLGLLSHGDTYKIEQNLLNAYWLVAEKWDDV